MTLFKSLSRRFSMALIAATGLSGCYLSHPLPDDAGASADAESIDAPRRDVRIADVAPDVPVPDAGPFECNGVRVAEAVEVRNEWVALTPRLVALPRGEVGLVSVDRDGSPTRLHYERLGRTLERLTGPVTLTNTSFGWGHPARVGDSLYVAYPADSRGDRRGRSRLHRFDLDGAELSPPIEVIMKNPSVLTPVGGGLFWLTFINGRPNELRAVHVDLGGGFLHDVRTIDMGRYGSGSQAIHRGDGAHILAYTREVGRGGRDSFANVVDARGTLGPEVRLAGEGDGGDITAVPVIANGELMLVRHNNDALFIERRDLNTMELVERRTFPPIGARPLSTQIGGRLLVFHHEGSQLHIDDFGDEVSEPQRLSVNIPGQSSGVAHLVNLDRAIAFVTDVSQDAETRFPFVLRFECMQ